MDLQISTKIILMQAVAAVIIKAPVIAVTLTTITITSANFQETTITIAITIREEEINTKEEIIRILA